MSKTFTLWGHSTGPNPWKVAMLLEELGLPYEHKIMDMADMKKEPFTKLNPNGRVPAIEDPNTGIVLWESGAIYEYLIAEYDKEHKISFASSPEKYQALSFLHFQMSGQGPYFGQAAWFTHFHPEKIPSAQARYIKEIARVTSVLDTVLQSTPYLVGGKFSFADLAFVPWYAMVGFLDQKKELDLDKDYPSYAKWMGTLMERESVKKVLGDRAKAMGQ